MKSKKTKIFIFLGVGALCFGILFFLLRGPYLSNSIKRTLVPVFENATQERVIIDKAVINLFPFYVQVKGFKLFDKDGNRLLWITKSRAYIDLLGLLSRQVRIRKLTLKEPDLTVNETDVQRIMDNLRKSELVGEEGKFRVTVKNVQLTDGNVSYKTSDMQSSFSGSGIYMDAVPKGISHIVTLLLKKGTLKLANQSELEGSFDTKVKIKENKIFVSQLNLSAAGSTLAADGEIILSPDGGIEDGSLSVNTRIQAETINLVHPMQEQSDALLTFQGFVRLLKREDSRWPGLAVDLKTDSRFYLESLMEILDVKEDISGALSVTGTITGTFPDVIGKGEAKLTGAVIVGLPLDEVTGELTYKDRKFALNGFMGRTYNGRIEGYGHVLIPSGNYMVDAHISDVNSTEFFKFIKWESPLPDGSLFGDIKLYHNKGHALELLADADYRSASHNSGNAVDRVSSGSAFLELKDNVLWFTDTVFYTRSSNFRIDGSIDFNKDSLDLDLKLDSADAADLTAPYYTGFSGQAGFEGKAAGLLKDPAITGKLTARDGSVHGIKFTKASADLKYKISSLLVDRLEISHGDAVCSGSGKIDFRKAEGILSFKAPYYRAKAECGNVELSPFIRELYRDIPVSGLVSGKVSFEGDSSDFFSPGELKIERGDAYGQKLDKVLIRYELRPKAIEFKSVKAFRAESGLEAAGTLSFNKKYNISVVSKGIRLRDLSAVKDSPFDMTFGLKVEGEGSIDDPRLKYYLNIKESSLKDVPVGGGEISGTVNNDKIRASGSFIDGLITSEGEAVVGDKIKWKVNSILREGRYDFLLKGFMKEVPEDFLLTLAGKVDVQGQGKSLAVSSKFSAAAISFYGYDLKNRDDIVVDIVDGEIRIKSFTFSGSKGDLYAAGTVKPKSRYDLHIKGNMEVAPLRALSDKILSLRGSGRFEVDIAGQWTRPEVYGQIYFRDTTASVTALPYKIGPLEGTFFLKKDRITFDSVRSKFAGGTIKVSGAGYLDGMSINRLFLSTDIDGIKIRPAEGLSTELMGKLFYDNSSKGSSLSGNIEIKKARYTKRIEWKSWLLGLKQVNNTQITYPSFLEGTSVNVHITGDENIMIDNNIARTPVSIALNLTGTINQKGLLGRIEASEGTVYFRSREFNILEGTNVDFVDPYSIAPVFHIIADTYIGDYYVKLNLDGTMENFSLSFFSDPPLSETEILAMLTTGQTGKEATGIDSGIAAGEATSLLTGGIQDTVEEQFQYFTGFERFSIEPHTTTEGAFVPRVTVGKRLFEDKLYVIYSTAIGTTEEDIIKLEYKIDKHLSLIGSRNEIGSAGVDLKYRFEFK
ncbi:MAG: translocation/assembly module TamB domain-containing protein [Nitrospirota bacterium]